MVRFAFWAMIFLMAAAPSWAASTVSKPDLEKFYKPIKKNDLDADLAPREGVTDRFGNSDVLFTGNGGCPDEINIGSVPDDTTVIGGTDINVNIEGDIIVKCGSGF